MLLVRSDGPFLYLYENRLTLQSYAGPRRQTYEAWFPVDMAARSRVSGVGKGGR